jgi:hypothetical protein
VYLCLGVCFEGIKKDQTKSQKNEKLTKSHY